MHNVLAVRHTHGQMDNLLGTMAVWAIGYNISNPNLWDITNKKKLNFSSHLPTPLLCVMHIIVQCIQEPIRIVCSYGQVQTVLKLRVLPVL